MTEYVTPSPRYSPSPSPMALDPTIRAQVYGYFLAEAQDLLTAIEQDLLSLREGNIRAKIHNMMRSAHTLKGGAASVEQETIKNVAHVMEDVFTALMSPGVEIDAEIESLLFQGYECLRLPLMAEVRGGQVDDSEILNRAAAVMVQLQTKLGDCFNSDVPLPTSSELGFDMVHSTFQVGVAQRLQDLENLLMDPDPQLLADQVQERAAVLLGLAESLNLPGFQAIAQATLTALVLHPDRAIAIAELALKDFSAGQAAVLAGDRSQGGTVSAALLQLTQREAAIAPTHLTVRPSELLIDEFNESLFTAAALRVNAPTPPLEVSLETSLEASSATTLEVPLEVPLTETELSLDELFGQYSTPTALSPDLSAAVSTAPADCVQSTPLNASLPREPSRLLEASVPPEPSVPPARSIPRDQSVTPAASVESILSEVFGGYASAEPAAEIALESLLTNVSNADKPVAAQWQSYVNAAEVPVRGRDAIAASIRVELSQLERLNYLAGELLIGQNTQLNHDDQQRSILQVLVKRLKKFQQTVHELRDFSVHGGVSHSGMTHGGMTHGGIHPATHQALTNPLADFDALELDRYSELDLLLQSALEDANQVESLAEAVDQLTKQSKRGTKAQQRFLTHLRDDLTNVRMQPLGELLQRFPRVLQQLANTYGKPVELVLNGANVLVDKAVVEKLYDPLLHLLRNAFDHGIESPEVRLSQGKSAVGKIEIQAYHQGNRTVIEIKDDGRGIDLLRIAQKGVELNLITETQRRQLSNQQILDLLFEPGFSTASQITDLSGRGVGLDVVRSQLHSLRGFVSVQSKPHQGTTFSLQLPLSLTIAKLLVCQTNGVSYALPVNVIEQVVRPTATLAGNPPAQRTILNWQHNQQDYEVSVRQLADLVQYSPLSQRLTRLSGKAESHAKTAVVVLRTAKGFCGLQVDQVLGEQELVIRALDSEIAPPPYVYGCCTLSSSHLALVIDPEALLQQSELSTPVAAAIAFAADAAPALTPARARPAVPSHILVIDDSFTLRQTVTLSLQKAGYRVSQAGDGLEALVYLRQHPNTVDLIICDVEMPGLNGFEFLSQSRQDAHLATIPVIMLTSRSTEKYRAMAQQLGASDYLTKPYTDGKLLSALVNVLETQSI